MYLLITLKYRYAFFVIHPIFQNLKEQNIKLMSEVNQLIEYNLNFKKQSDSEKVKSCELT